MRFADTKGRAPRRRWGFTLAEVLAALAFMAIVIPVAVEGLRVANLAGQVGERKSEAARVAERILNEYLITNQGLGGTSGGAIQEGMRDYQWTLRTDTWREDTMRLVTVEVVFTVQGRDYRVHLSTLTEGTG
jgi:type II secretory pathway pseudopilin PulG